MNYAATGRLQKPEAVQPDINPFEHPDAQRRFRVLDNKEELERALDYPWDKWAVFLHPSQRHVVEQEFSGPARVSGSAGTGKTVVALHRAANIIKVKQEARILLTTFSSPLANALKHKIKLLTGIDSDDGSKISIYSFQGVAHDLFTLAYGHTPRGASREQVKGALEAAKEQLEDSEFTVRFLVSEWIILFTSTRTEALLFRQEWGTYIWAGTIVFSFLTLMYAVQGIVLAYLAYKKEQEQKKALRFVPLLQKSWWHLAKQQDGSFCSQISLDVQASNSTTAPVNLVMVDLDRPKNSVLQAFVLLPADGSPYHSHQHPVPAQATITASVHIMVRGALSRQGKPIHINLSIVDQHGTAYKLRKLHIKTHDIALRRRGIFQWIKDCRIKRQPPPVMPWNFSQDEYLQLCDAVLQEEKRSYAANGRLRGGLGSLNVTLQSEPNFGWTTVGQIPQLLWPQGQGVTITSTNMTRLLNIHSGLDAQGKDNLERYLLAHLIKDSDFSDIGYFIFLALHRMERTVDALKTARTFLKGDRVHGYSNLLGTLSAVVSHEHVHFDHHLYQPLLDALSNDDEHDFRLRHKINLARLEHLDRTDTPTENITH